MEVEIRKIKTDLNAFEIYSLFGDFREAIFLDSAKDPDHLGRYSFIGLNPFKKIMYKDGVLIEDGITREADPFEALGMTLADYQIDNKSKLPFVGGCMGYFAYDLIRDIEKLPELHKDHLDMPTMYFVFYDNIIVYDHHRNEVYITELTRMSGAKSQLDEIEAIISKGNKHLNGMLVKGFDHKFISPFSKETYMEAVESMRSYIKAGDIYIANMTHTYETVTTRGGFDIYKSLRRYNKAPFAAYMPLEGFEVMSSSPERFIRIKDGKAMTRPIKGTRPRGKTKEEDARYLLELEQSEKDKSELLMIVDLERNDLSKVCRPYTVKVTELFNIESYATVHHLVATVVGELRTNQSAVDCIRACFPGGSITGTPKIRAMEIIEELEKSRRQLYTGCIGYFGFDGSADFNIVIRTVIKKGSKLYIGVGGGITWESDAEAEYQETLDKAGILFDAINGVEEAT